MEPGGQWDMDALCMRSDSVPGFWSKRGIMMQNRVAAGCDFCANYEYDEEDGSYVCMADMDEDEYYHLLTSRSFSCPFYRSNDEYEVVRHQI